MNPSLKIALADDHVLLREGLAGLVTRFGYEVIFQADDGEEVMERVQKGQVPDLVLMDINMKKVDGYTATLWLRNTAPEVKVLALSMYDDEKAVMRMLKNGARGYILKDSEPAELRAALDALVKTGYYYSEMVTGKLVHSLRNSGEREDTLSSGDSLSERETEFLKYAVTELTYKEIADQMHLSPRTIDGYRDALFEKLGLKSRVGLAVYAIRNGIVRI